MIVLKDVAKLAQVSLMTVSRAINSPEQLKPETLRRVQQAIQDTGYIPTLSAKKIRSIGSGQSTHTLGVLIQDTMAAPFCADMSLAIEETVRAHHWNSVSITMLEDDDPNDVINLMLTHRPDGIIYATMSLATVQIPQRLKSLPLVLANCETLHSKWPTYMVNDEMGQYYAVSALLTAGYKKPLCLHLPEYFPATQRRLKGLQRACLEQNIKSDSLSHYFMATATDPYVDLPRIVQRHLLSHQRDFDSVVCGNDRIAFMVYQLLLGAGVGIPNDIAVVGYDNRMGIADLFIPPLSTVQLPHYEIGRQSALHIIHAKTHQDTIFISPIWSERGSVVSPLERTI